MELGNIPASETVSYVKDAVIVIAVVSPTLAGLTGVLIGQIQRAELRRGLRCLLMLILGAVFGLAWVTTTNSIDWLLSPGTLSHSGIATGFAVQIGLFMGAAALFWVFAGSKDRRTAVREGRKKETGD